MSDGFHVEIDQAQLDALLSKLDPKMVEAHIKELMQVAAGEGEDIAREAIRGGTEYAMKSIRAKSKPMEATVYSIMAQDRALSIEQGRPPGQPPSLTATARWLTGSLHFTGRRFDELSRPEKEQILSARESIRVSGARGKKFLHTTKEALSRLLPGMLQDVARNIESRWRS